MPIVLRVRGYAFGFYASDRDEPPHVHATSQGRTAKFWLDPNVTVERAGRFRPQELNEIRRIIIEHRIALLEAWHAYFPG